MAPPEPIEPLIQHYLDGRSSLADSIEMARLLCNDPAAADAFARATRFDALLETHFCEQGATTELMGKPRAPARWMLAATAAAVLAIVGGGWWWNRDGAKVAAPHRVTSGRVLVDGVEASTITDGSLVEVLGTAAAAIDLGDGSDVRLAPASAVVVHTGAGAGVPSVLLSYGNATFRSRHARRSIRVDTPVGAVSARDAEFAVELQSTSDNRARPLRPNLLGLLTVAVLTGRVEVQDAGEKVQVAAGESRAFSPEKKPKFAGRVASVSSDGKRIVLEGMPVKAGAPPQQREVRITDQTQLTYYGMPKDGDRPTVGYPAIALLDKAAPEKAIAVEFGDKTPHVEGMVKRTADDGRTVTVEIYRKNDVPAERTVTLNERTRVSYSGVDAAGEKPTVGYRASIWLEGDTATEIRFLFKSKGGTPTPEAPKPPPIKKPRDPKPATELKTDKAPSDKKPRPISRRTSTRDPLPVATEIDAAIDGRLGETRIPASPTSEDAEFLRRASIDITGQIPTYAAAVASLESRDPRKRQTLIDDLLSNPAYGRRFGAAWKRLISPRPATNGKPQVDKVTPWLAEQFNSNRGWNEVVSEFLTTEANLGREPQAYFLAVNSQDFEPKPNLLAASTARLFLGVQLACAECHDHPFAKWKQTEFWNLAAFFSRVHKRSKSDASWTEEPTDPPRAATITIPEGGEGAGTLVPARFLGGVEAASDPSAPLRPVLAAWVTAADNPYFARAAVNRLWAHFFGRGLVEPLDGFQPGFSATHPSLLDRLADEFVASGYDVQHIIRTICNTRAYGRTSRPSPENEKDTVLLSHMAVKVLSPDALYDSLSIAINGNPTPAAAGKNGKVAQAAPVSIGPRDEFLNFFSGPAAESKANEYAHGIPQLLRLMNAEAFNVGAPLAKAVARSEGTPEEKVAMLYLATLSRRPTEDERRALAGYVAARQGTEQAYAGALWILLNTSGFVSNR